MATTADVVGKPMDPVQYRAHRNRLWENIDKNTKDSQGNPIIFGPCYSYERGKNKYAKVYPCGLDLRGNPGWVFAWVVGDDHDGKDGRYCALVSESMTPNPDKD